MVKVYHISHHIFVYDVFSSVSLNAKVKDYKNQTIFVKVIVKIIVLCFLDHIVIIFKHLFIYNKSSLLIYPTDRFV